MFDWSEENKNKYYDQAEEILHAAGLNCFHIDRTMISVVKQKKVKVYLAGFTKKTVTREQLAAIKALPGFVVIHDRYKRERTGKMKPIYESGYFLLDVEG